MPAEVEMERGKEPVATLKLRLDDEASGRLEGDSRAPEADSILARGPKDEDNDRPLLPPSGVR